jgi:ATP-dependent DNA helicase RecQ
MGLKIGTIMRYLDRANTEGWMLPVDPLIEMSELSDHEREKVIASFQELGINRLKPTFDALEGKVSYDELHVWRLIFKISHQKE